VQRGRNTDARQAAITADEFCARHFGEIVILRRNPENGDRGSPALRQTSGELNGRERLVDGVERSCEEARLLARDDREAVGLAQPLDIGQDFRARAPAAVHRGERIAERAPVRPVCAEDFGRTRGELMMKAHGGRIEAA
jgi:hypothetical protein